MKASEPSGEVVENAWQTFYLNVAATNPDLAAWKTGSVANNNVLGDFNSIYVYSSQDTDKPNSGWPTDLQSYGKDLKQINNNYFVKADLIGYNDKQQDLLADALVHPVLYASQLNSSYKIDGLAMDLEGGFTQTRAAEVFKKVADRLAYHGKWFTFFYFSSGFTPVTSAAFSPLGVANFRLMMLQLIVHY